MTADVCFPSMGSDARLVLEGADPDRARAFLVAFERQLTRFDATSELCALNAAPQAAVPASPLLRRAVRAGLWAAARSGGLVDPTLLAPLRAAGYDRTRRTAELPLTDALLKAPPRAAARPAPAARWRLMRVDDEAGVVHRPAGLEFDTGGTGKGLAADLVAVLVGDAERFAVDCGGDLRIGGARALERPFDVCVRHPLTGEVAHELQLAAGGVATSGLDVRLWRDAAGRPAHHLLDPSTGRPAWTGLVGATAAAPTALEAEVLAKTALLSGPGAAARVLTRYGGLVVHDDGDIELFGRFRPRTIITVRNGARFAHKAAA